MRFGSYVCECVDQLRQNELIQVGANCRIVRQPHRNNINHQNNDISSTYYTYLFSFEELLYNNDGDFIDITSRRFVLEKVRRVR